MPVGDGANANQRGFKDGDWNDEYISHLRNPKSRSAHRATAMSEANWKRGPA